MYVLHYFKKKKKLKGKWEILKKLAYDTFTYSFPLPGKDLGGKK